MTQSDDKKPDTKAQDAEKQRQEDEQKRQEAENAEKVRKATHEQRRRAAQRRRTAEEDKHEDDAEDFVSASGPRGAFNPTTGKTDEHKQFHGSGRKRNADGREVFSDYLDPGETLLVADLTARDFPDLTDDSGDSESNGGDSGGDSGDSGDSGNG